MSMFLSFVEILVDNMNLLLINVIFSLKRGVAKLYKFLDTYLIIYIFFQFWRTLPSEQAKLRPEGTLLYEVTGV